MRLRYSLLGHDDVQRSQSWWGKELTRKCDGYLNNTLSYSQVVDDGSTLLMSSPPAWANKRGGGQPSDPRQPKRPKPSRERRRPNATGGPTSETAVVPHGTSSEPWWWDGHRG